MKALNDIQEVYFIGIGGIGMSALARYFMARGAKVSGYDKTETLLTKTLVDEGAKVHYEDDITQVSVNADIVVYTPAIPADHKELNWCRDHGMEVLKRSDVLGIITKEAFNICVAGTHGKTTVTTMTAHILRHSGYGCNAFLGGISANYNTNFWSSENNVCVIEADEYDRSFLKLFPDVAVVTAMDADHLDIYGTGEEVEKSFIDFTANIKKAGVLFSKWGLKNSNRLKADTHLLYHLNNPAANIYATDIVVKEGGYQFNIQTPVEVLKGVELKMGGLHNIENVLAAAGVALQLGVSAQAVKTAVADFKGVKRRFERIAETDEVIYIDDYAHHPEELNALISGVRSLFPHKKCTIIFQPHLYTRTRDFADGFADSLDKADEVILLPIYPARELPIAGVSSELLLDKMTLPNRCVKQKEQVLQWVKEHDFKAEVLLTAGAGDIDKLIEPIEEIINQKGN